MRRALFFAASFLAACSFTTAGNFKECDHDSDCGSAAVCSYTYCLPLPEGCTRASVSAADHSPYQQANRVPLVALLPLHDGDVVDDSERAGLDAITLALTQVNDLDGIGLQRRFGLYVCDTRRNEAVLQSQLEWVVRNLETPAVFTSGSGQTKKAAYNPVRVDAGTLIMSATATAAELSSAFTTTGNVWRVAPDDTLQARVIFNRYIKSDFPSARLPDGGQVSVAIAYETGSYGDGFEGPIEHLLSDAGYLPLPMGFSASDTTLGNTPGKLVVQLPQATVVVALPTNVARLVTTTASSLGSSGPAQAWFPAHKWYLSDAAKDPVISQGTVGALLNGSRGTAPSQGKGNQQAYTLFSANYQSAFGEDPITYSFTSHSYDAAWLVMLAAASASNGGGAITGPRMAVGMTRLQNAVIATPVTPTNWTSLSDELARGGTIDLDGVSGPLTFNLDAGSPSSRYELWHVVADGGIVTDTDVDP